MLPPLRCCRVHECALRRPLTLALCVRTGVARTAAGVSTQGPPARTLARRAGTEGNDSAAASGVRASLRRCGLASGHAACNWEDLARSSLHVSLSAEAMWDRYI